MTDPIKPLPTSVAHAQRRVHEHFRAALETIDAELGAGEARKNPALVAAFVQAASIESGAAAIADALHRREGRVPVLGEIS